MAPARACASSMVGHPSRTRTPTGCGAGAGRAVPCPTGAVAGPRQPVASLRALGGALAHPLALVWIEVALAQPKRLRRHLDPRVVLDIRDRLLEGPPRQWRQQDVAALAGGPGVGERLGDSRGG